MKLYKRLSSNFRSMFFKKLLAKKAVSTATISLVSVLSLFMLVSVGKKALVKQPATDQVAAVADVEQTAQSEPRGLSRQRKDFEKALDILAGGATADQQLAKYFDRVQRRVKGESSAPEKESFVRVSKHSPAPNASARAAAQLKSDAAATTQDKPKASADELKGFASGSMIAQARRVSTASSEATDAAAVKRARLTVGDVAFDSNPAIEKWVSYYTATQRGRTTMEIGMERSSDYIDMAREEFRQMGVPEDLVWLAFVESVWHPTALSPAAACGIWQFIPRTATDYGLTVSQDYDERLDPYKQTRVAATYLQDLHTIFGDWALAMAAYNCGEPRVMDAIVKNGRANFWDLYEKRLLPDETRNYVPKILAAIKVASEPQAYGLTRGSDVDADVAGR